MSKSFVFFAGLLLAGVFLLGCTGSNNSAQVSVGVGVGIGSSPTPTPSPTGATYAPTASGETLSESEQAELDQLNSEMAQDSEMDSTTYNTASS